LKANEFRRKAIRSLAAARLLLENGYTDEASSRAYYAMFDAARAALAVAKAPVDAEVARTHGGLMSAFARYLVRPGLVSPQIGRTFAQAQHIRLVADYKGDPVSAAEAARAVEWAAAFIDALATIS
jgi:uncharacterized protein